MELKIFYSSKKANWKRHLRFVTAVFKLVKQNARYKYFFEACQGNDLKGKIRTPIVI